MKHFTKVTYMEEKEQLLKSCPLPCDQVSYDINVRKYQTTSWVIYDDQGIEDISQTGVSLALSYESLLVEERIETLVYDTGNLLSAIGGNLGLFLGLSCLTILLGIWKAAQNLYRKFYHAQT